MDSTALLLSGAGFAMVLSPVNWEDVITNFEQAVMTKATIRFVYVLTGRNNGFTEFDVWRYDA